LHVIDETYPEIMIRHALIPDICRQFLHFYGLEDSRDLLNASKNLLKEDRELNPEQFFEGLIEYGALIELIFLHNDITHADFAKLEKEAHYPMLVLLKSKTTNDVVPAMFVPSEKKEAEYVVVFKKDNREVFSSADLSKLPYELSASHVEGHSDKVNVITCFPNTQLDENLEKSAALSGGQSRFVVLSKFFNVLAAEKSEIGYVLLYAIFVGLISLTLPLGVQSLIGFISSGQVVTSVVVLITFIVFGVLLSGVMTIMQLHLVEHIHQRLFAKTAFSFAFRVPRIKMESVLKYYPPELMNRFFDTLTLMKGMSVMLIDLSSAFLQTVFGIILLSLYHPMFLVLGTVLMLILFLILRLTGPKGLKTALKESAFKYMTANWLEEIARTLSTFKLAGNTNFAIEKTDYYVSNYIQAREDHFKVLKTQYYSFVIFKTVITALLLILGAVLITNRQINLGQFVAAEIVIILIMNSIEKIILKLDTVYDVLVSVEKISDVTSLPVETYKGIDLPVKPNEGIAVKLKEVQYRFPDRHDYVLNNVNLEIKKGERVCVAGFNGSGKTTLANLVIGLYEGYNGIITYNGISLRDINKASLMNHLGDYVSQEGLFDGTIYENIAIGRGNCPMANVQWAIEAAGLSDFIHNLPDGLNTRLIGGTVRISESMARKIIIARNIVERPGLLVLDDFLLGVERREKKRILDLILSDEFGWTVLLISNDPLIMDTVDRVVVMRSGTVTDSGAFRELIDRNRDLQDLIKDYNLI
jgi:ABC-type bacteriocin/lantibiotic exporter with double-glycine peptidase domain